MGEKIKALLTEKGLMQRDLANAIGVSECAVSRFIKGTKTPSVALLKEIADYLGVTVDELIA